ncbi:MAG: response regulator transcription factor [Chloroflexi bacterium]|nr:response regulator transcription factor [Chloroflexota bacterium]
MKKIRVVVADDHTLVREGVRLLLEAQCDIEVVGEACDGREALTLAGQHRPDVVVMDIQMPNLNGLDATRAIKSQVSGTQIVMLTMHDSDEYFFRVLACGASGYVLKKAASPREREVLKLIAEGHTNQVIAEKLVISPSTVQTHRTRIMQRLNLQTRAELIQYARNKGLLDNVS